MIDAVISQVDGAVFGKPIDPTPLQQRTMVKLTLILLPNSTTGNIMAMELRSVCHGYQGNSYLHLAKAVLTGGPSQVYYIIVWTYFSVKGFPQ
jgi:hypothetical protein